jgi:hypothetical protein
LNSAGETTRKIVNEHAGAPKVTVSHHERWNHLCLCINGDPRPHVSEAELPFHSGGDVLLFDIHKRPAFIALDALTVEVDQCAVLIVGARIPDIWKEIQNRIECYVTHTRCGPERIPLDKGTNYLAFLLRC